MTIVHNNMKILNYAIVKKVLLVKCVFNTSKF